MRVVVVGTGYVGLVQGAGLASVGHDVTCVDTDQQKVWRLQEGRVPFYEPGLDELVKTGVEAGKLRFTDERGAIANADVVFLAVGTPRNKDGSADLSQVEAAAASIGAVVPHGPRPLVVTKSTVPPGTTINVVKPHVEPAPVASNPEFLKEGDAVRDFLHPDRIVIGTERIRDAELLANLYAPFVRTGAPLLFMDPTSAELTKYANNAMLATRISLMNEVAAIAEKVGADVDHVRRAVGADKRIGSSFLFPGIGWGGSCFGKDVSALARLAESHKVLPAVLNGTTWANELARGNFVEKIYAHFNGDVAGRNIAVWGLAFKPGTDDVRDSPAIQIIAALAAHGAKIRAHDPRALDQADLALAGLGVSCEMCTSAMEAVYDVEALVLCTEWPEYRAVDLKDVRSAMGLKYKHALFDGRNVFDPEVARAAGFTYYGVGRPAPR